MLSNISIQVGCEVLNRNHKIVHQWFQIGSQAIWKQSREYRQAIRQQRKLEIQAQYAQQEQQYELGTLTL